MAPRLPLTLYVHLPWCVRKCPYCDFNSHPGGREAPPFDAYVERLLLDLDSELREPAARRPIGSIFIGGGTPSLFPGPAIRRLLDGIRARIELIPDVEITLEANPGTVDAAHFAAYRAAGPAAVQGFRQVLEAMMDPETRAQYQSMKDLPE